MKPGAFLPGGGCQDQTAQGPKVECKGSHSHRSLPLRHPLGAHPMSPALSHNCRWSWRRQTEGKSCVFLRDGTPAYSLGPEPPFGVKDASSLPWGAEKATLPPGQTPQRPFPYTTASPAGQRASGTHPLPPAPQGNPGAAPILLPPTQLKGRGALAKIPPGLLGRFFPGRKLPIIFFR